MACRFGSVALVAVLGVVVLLSACAKCNGNTDPATMGPLSTVMQRVAKQAQGLLLTGEADPARPDTLPALVLAGDDEAREMLADYQLRAVILRDKDGRPRPVILLCTGDGGHALIERMDCLNSVRKGQHWQARPLPPCQVTFSDPAAACAGN
ncbi:hypothetical protein [Nitratidesulfovibrio sp. 1201_IL3209]|uniref:hypothetical protein n=1 Tax=Nitratidesulfovibrio sp. 1201_IL3209 TaxID=3084053 RepID=UPI002FD8CD1F